MHPEDRRSEPVLGASSTGRMLSHRITSDEDGEEVQVICRRVFGFSRHEVSRAKFRPDGLMVDGKRTFSTHRVRTGQLLEVAIGDTLAKVLDSRLAPSTGPLNIVYEDADLLVVDKPAGLAMHSDVVHRADTLGSRVRAHLVEQGVQATFHAVHRLDRSTSGLVVIATNAHAQAVLQRRMHTPRFSRTYLGVVEHGFFDPGRVIAPGYALAAPEGPLPCPGEMTVGDTGTVTLPIAAEPDRRGFQMVSQEGKYSCTHYRVLDELPAGLLVRFSLETGRTHQIRVHMAAIGHPLIGDDRYGRVSARIARAALHSAHLVLDHPVTGERLEFDSPFPEDMRSLAGG